VDNQNETAQPVEAAETAAPEIFPLDEAAIAMIAELDQQMQPLQTALNAVLTYFARQHNLQGRWTLAPNKNELVKRAE